LIHRLGIYLSLIPPPSTALDILLMKSDADDVDWASWGAVVAVEIALVVVARRREYTTNWAPVVTVIEGVAVPRRSGTIRASAGSGSLATHTVEAGRSSTNPPCASYKEAESKSWRGGRD
jgi:hypothetical protein